MRQIKFKGLRTDGKGWVYGSYIEFKGESEIMVFFDTTSKREHKYKRIFLDKRLITETIMPDEQGWDYGSQIRFHEVTPDTVGQFTGLHDKNGVEIYDGDRVRHNDNIFVVKYSENQHVLLLRVENDKGMNWRSLQWLAKVSKYCKVIGNIHTQDGGQEG